MKKVLAAGVGLLLTVATAAHAEGWSRDRDPGADKPSTDQGSEVRSEQRAADQRTDGAGDRGGNNAGANASGEYERAGASSAMFRDVDARDSNQRSARETTGHSGGGAAYGNGAYRGGANEGSAPEQALRYGNTQSRYSSGTSGARSSNDGGYRSGTDSGYRDGEHREGDGFRGDRRDYRGDSRADGNRYRGGYDDRYRGGYDSQRGYRGGYDNHRGYRGSWNNHRYRSPWRYAYPRGYGARSWSIGLFLPSAFYGPSYYVDYAPYGLEPPPYGYEWVRVDSDVLLIEIRTGLIVDILYGFYY